MTIRVAINGFGRIGRNILRAHFEYNKHSEIQIVAINDLADIETNAHLIRYDSVHGPFKGKVETSAGDLIIDNKQIKVFAERDPKKLPWGDLGVDVVLECTGLFASRVKALAHIDAGAKKVIISAPAGKDLDATIVFGVNHGVLKAEDTIISNASCTTNCLAPVVKPLHQHLGIVNGLMTTVHAFTNDQMLTDSYHKDIYRARATTQSIIPTKTGAAAAVGLVLPELAGKLDGMAMRVPVANVSVVDLTFISEKATSVDEVNEIIKTASENELSGILEYNNKPLVSIDFNHNPASSIFDANQTRVIGNTVKILAWYDNEWGFSNRMLDTTNALMNAE